MYQKRGRTNGDPINCFFKSKHFYIGFKIMFLKILNKEIKMFFKQLWLFFVNS